MFIENIAERHPLSIIGVSLSFWNQRGKSNHAFLNIIEQTFPNKLLKTKVRRDIKISEASIFGKPLFETAPTTRAAEDYRKLAKEIVKRL